MSSIRIKCQSTLSSPKSDPIQIPKVIPIILQWDESFDISSDTITGVNDEDYKPPFPRTAKLDKLTIKIDRPQLTPEEIKKFQEAMQVKAGSD